MSKIEQPYRCDAQGCGKLREKDANHWWLVWRTEVVIPGADESPVKRCTTIHASPWIAHRAEADGVNHVCGIDCMLKIIAGFANEIIQASAGKES